MQMTRSTEEYEPTSNYFMTKLGLLIGLVLIDISMISIWPITGRDQGSLWGLVICWGMLAVLCLLVACFTRTVPGRRLSYVATGATLVSTMIGAFSFTVRSDTPVFSSLQGLAIGFCVTLVPVASLIIARWNSTI